MAAGCSQVNFSRSNGRSRRPSSSSSSQAPARRRRQRQLGPTAAAAATDRLAVNSTFEQYILDLQDRIIKAGAAPWRMLHSKHCCCPRGASVVPHQQYVHKHVHCTALLVVPHQQYAVRAQTRALYCIARFRRQRSWMAAAPSSCMTAGPAAPQTPMPATASRRVRPRNVHTSPACLMLHVCLPDVCPELWLPPVHEPLPRGCPPPCTNPCTDRALRLPPRCAVLEGGSALEKAAANISVVAGVLSPERAKAMSSRGRSAIDPAGGQSYSGVWGTCGWRFCCVNSSPLRFISPSGRLLGGVCGSGIQQVTRRQCVPFCANVAAC